jgi:perosamine synthetase
MERLLGLLADKRQIASEYAGALADIGIPFVAEPADCIANFWLCAMLLSGPAERDAFLAASAAANIQCRPAWTPLHLLPMYANSPRWQLPVTEEIAGRLINLPSAPRVTI